MKPIYLISGLLLFSLRAQAPTPVLLARGNAPGEPHHHLKIENSYVRAYYVEVPPHGETQLHQHDNDYIFVTLGDSDVTNAVLGKPEVHLQLKDGEIRFTRGGFAHVARNNSDAPFRNVTIEFLRPQGEVHNRCETVVANAPRENCDEKSDILPSRPAGSINHRSLFETDQVLVQEWGMGVSAAAPWRTVMNLEVVRDRQDNCLIVGLGPAPMKVHSGKEKATLAPGEMSWIASRPKIEFEAPLSETNAARFLVISFKGDVSTK